MERLDHALTVGGALGMRNLGHPCGKPLDLLKLHAVPGRIADDRIEAARGRGAFPISPDTGKGRLPMQKAPLGGKRAGVGDKRRCGFLHRSGVECAASAPQDRPGFARRRKRRAIRDLDRRSVIPAEQHFAGKLRGSIGRPKPARSMREVKKGAQFGGVFLDPREELGAALDLADVGIRGFLNPGHPGSGLPRLRDITGDDQPVAVVQLALDRGNKLAEQRVAATQMMIKKRHRRADGE